MRKFLKNSILEIFQTMYEAHSSIKKMIDKKDLENIQVLLEDCQNTAIQIGTSIESTEGEGFVTVGYLEEYCEAVYEVATSISDDCSGNKAQKTLDKKLIKAENSVKNDIKVRLEVVFCPYKASMWDSLESVWRAANEDPDCDAYVVPIPYYDRNPDYSFGEFHYEGGDFPDYVPITHYEAYNFEMRRPDVVYIHNPYDEYNNVTSVDPRFYSHELKKYTDCLVYVPYFISGCYSSYDTVKNNTPSAFFYVDYIIIQSNVLKKYYEYGNVPSQKLLVLGSPKVDYIVNNLDAISIPTDWKKKISDKKVFLYNTSISFFLCVEWEDWLKEFEYVLDSIHKEDCILLWRPHPLLESTIKSMRPMYYPEFVSLKEKLLCDSNVIFDETPEAYLAMKCADAMISDYSSLIFQFSFTEKPTLMLSVSESLKHTSISCIDFYDNYFNTDEFTFSDFISIVKSDNDFRKESRMSNLRKSIAYSDGSCGQAVHETICKKLMR